MCYVALVSVDRVGRIAVYASGFYLMHDGKIQVHITNVRELSTKVG
jgi:hypothetical protein